jgi:large subunit ribosomal protein L33
MGTKTRSIVVKLVSMAGTGYYYVTRKNAQMQKKLLLRKYDPVIRQHTLFRVCY